MNIEKLNKCIKMLDAVGLDTAEKGEFLSIIDKHHLTQFEKLLNKIIYIGINKAYEIWEDWMVEVFNNIKKRTK